MLFLYPLHSSVKSRVESNGAKRASVRQREVLQTGVTQS